VTLPWSLFTKLIKKKFCMECHEYPTNGLAAVPGLQTDRQAGVSGHRTRRSFFNFNAEKCIWTRASRRKPSILQVTIGLSCTCREATEGSRGMAPRSFYVGARLR
jgi:hypothetical protein